MRRQSPPGPWQDSIARQYHKYVAAHGIPKARLLTCSRYDISGLELHDTLAWVKIANHCDRYGIDLQTYTADQARLTAARTARTATT